MPAGSASPVVGARRSGVRSTQRRYSSSGCAPTMIAGLSASRTAGTPVAPPRGLRGGRPSRAAVSGSRRAKSAAGRPTSPRARVGLRLDDVPILAEVGVQQAIVHGVEGVRTERRGLGHEMRGHAVRRRPRVTLPHAKGPASGSEPGRCHDRVYSRNFSRSRPGWRARAQQKAPPLDGTPPYSSSKRAAAPTR